MEKSDNMKKKAVIFDLDGTLWDAAETIAPAWNAYLEGRGIALRMCPDDCRACCGKARCGKACCGETRRDEARGKACRGKARAVKAGAIEARRGEACRRGAEDGARRGPLQRPS